MATLRKGAKGKPVEALQHAINKLGMKPELNVDGIFGPLTEKGVRAAQKKLKTPGSDGKAVDVTLAAIKYGKPLPKMTVPDVKKSPLGNEAAFRNLTKIEQQLKKLLDSRKALEQTMFNFSSDLFVATRWMCPLDSA